VTRSLPLRRTLAAAAISPLLLTGLAACGGDDSGSAASGSDSPAASTSGGTQVLADVSEGDEVAPQDFVDAVRQGLEASTTAHMTMDLALGSAGTMKGQGDVDYTTTPPEMAMTMTLPSAMSPGGSAAWDMRLVDGVMYLSAGQLTGGKFWKIDPSDKNNPLGASGIGGMLDQLNPAAAMEKLGSAIDEVTYVGQEDVDGRSLDHYTLTLDMAAALKSLGNGSLPQGAQGQLPKSLTYDTWLDDQGRVGKMTMELPIAGSTSTMEMEMTDWGEDVDISAPPSDQITKVPGLGSFQTPPPAA
jgi:hypothetical protein